MDTTDWIVPQTSDVLAQFNGSELAAYDAAKADANSADLGLILGSVCNQIRLAYVNGGRVLNTTLTGSIPTGEFSRAVAIARWKYLLALPTGGELATKERQAAHDEAETWFMKIAAREIKTPGSVAIARPGERVQNFGVIGGTGRGGCGYSGY